MKQLFKFCVLVLSIVFVSCSDIEVIWVKPELPQDIDVTLLDMWAHEVSFQEKVMGIGVLSRRATGFIFTLQVEVVMQP